MKERRQRLGLCFPLVVVELGPLDGYTFLFEKTRLCEIVARSMVGNPNPYDTRVLNLVSRFPNANTHGFSQGSICHGGRYEQLCKSAMRHNYQCLPVGMA